VRGLRTKLCELRSAVFSTSESYDIIILVETWLSGDVPDAELGLANYNIFRLDRKSSTSVHIRGGGVMIAVKNSLFCRELRIFVDCVEQIFINIHIGHKHVIVGAVYIPPSSDADVYAAHCNYFENIFSMSPNTDILIIGDYNLPNVRWFNDTNGSLQYTLGSVCSNNIRQADTLYAYFNEFNFYQHNNISNMHGNTLDLFSNLRCIRVLPAHDPLLPCDIFHPPLTFSLPISGTAPVEITEQIKFDFKRANFSVINDYLNSWDMELRDLNVDDAVNLVYYHLNHIIDSCVPSYTISRSSYPIWFSKKFISAINNKRKAHFSFKCTSSYFDYLIFSHY